MVAFGFWIFAKAGKSVKRERGDEHLAGYDLGVPTLRSK